MRKYAKILLSALLIIALQAGPVSSMFLAYAAGNDVTDQVASQFITGVDLKEKTGAPVENEVTLVGQQDIDPITQFYLWYDFTVPNVHSIEAGDYIVFDVPQAIVFPGDGASTIQLPDLIIDGEGPIAEAYLDPGNKIRLVFKSAIETLSNVGGAFYIAGSFDPIAINTDGSDTDINFTVPQRTVTLSFQAAPPPEPEPVTVTKDGAIMNGTSIEWTITVDKADFSATNVVENAVLTDVIPASQSLDVSSIEVNNAAPDASDISLVGNTLNLSLGTISSKQEITFVTTLTEQALLDALAEGKASIDVTNDAQLTHDDNQTTPAEHPKTVTIPINILSKSGNYLPATTVNNTKNIEWTIVVNEDELTFDNAVIEDKLPGGLTFIAGSETITGATGVTPTVNGSDVTFNLGNITGKVTITYLTEIDPARFTANGSYNFNNTAVLTWDGLTGTGISKSANVGVGSNLFTKSGAGYNRSNGVISWSMTINNESINLAAPTITDIIPNNQQYIEGSARIVDHQGNVYAGGTLDYDTATKTLSYTFNSAINSKYVLTFDTKPVSTENITSNSSGQFTNKATFTSGTISFDSTGTQSFSSNVLRKEQAGYNISNRHVTWRFIVNENGDTTPSSNAGALDPSFYQANPLTNVVITDAIPAGLAYAGNFSMVDSLGADASSLVTVNEDNGVVTVSFNQPITKKYVILFDTQIVDESHFTVKDNSLNNGNFSITNEATLTHNGTTKTNKMSATQEIKNRIVSKMGIPPTFGNKYIDWVVYLNSNAVNLNSLLNVDSFWLIDNLQEGLELDTTSVSLIAYDQAVNLPNSIPASGDDGLGAGRAITLDGSHIKYDATTRQFRLNFPGDIATAYKLSFRTYVTENVVSGAQFSNDINLFGSKNGTPVNIDSAYQSSDARQVSFLEGGSLGYGNLGKLVVKKVDLEDTNKKLSGATFALFDRFGNKVQEKATVDGELEFNRIKIDLPYYVKEVEAPTGYLLSGDVSVDGTAATLTGTSAVVADAIEAQLDSATNQKSMELIFKNQKIKATIQFVKQNEAGDALAGAQFGLFERGAPASSAPLATATSTSSGIVSFADVVYGQYDIREISAPVGYRSLTGVVHEVEVTAQDHGQTLNLAPVANELIKANIKFVKKNTLGAGIAGAEFGLYDGSNQLAATASSTADGTVEFKDVLAGQYTIRETAAPFGYVPLTGDIGTATITEAEYGTTILLADVTNELIQSDIEFVKHTENNLPLEGARFGLYGASDELVQSQVSQSDGKVKFTNVGQGTYTIREIEAPYGYLTDSSDIYNVTITANDHHQTVSLAPVVNTLIKANIEFKKVNAKGDGLAGAEFVLLDVNDSEAVVQTATSGSDGRVTFTDVHEGKYLIREKTAPVGYNPLTGDVATVDIDALKHNTTVTLPDVTNQIIKGDVEFVKVAKYTGLPLENARFALYAADDTTYDREIATATSDDQGIVRFEDVEYGDYAIIEVTPPSGYNLSKDKLSVSVRQEGETYSLGNFENEPTPASIIVGTIEVKKVNVIGAPLAGAKFGLYDLQGELVKEAVTNSSGIARFLAVPAGAYTVKELEAPANYAKTDRVEKAVIATMNNEVKLTFVNERSGDAPWPNVSVRKVDDAGKPLAGVKFALYKAEDASFATPVATSATNSEGVATFKNIIPGEYVVKETEALKGYILTNATLPVTVTEEAKIHNAGTIVNKLIRGDIVITKVNEHKEPLQGAKFGLYDGSGKLVQSVVSNSEGIASFKDVPYGTYHLHELVAPESYQKSTDKIAISITVDGEVLAYSIINKKSNVASEGNGGTPGQQVNGSDDEGTSDGGDGSNGSVDGNSDDNGGGGEAVAGVHSELPKTGDTIAAMIWLFVGSGALILALLVVGRRVRKQ